MNLAINDTITWVSAAGNLTGKITNIVLAENARGETVPWIDVTRVDSKTSIRLCAVKTNLVAMHITKVDDTAPEMMEVNNLMTGKKVLIAKDTPWCCNPASETYWSM